MTSSASPAFPELRVDVLGPPLCLHFPVLALLSGQTDYRVTEPAQPRRKHGLHHRTAETVQGSTVFSLQCLGQAPRPEFRRPARITVAPAPVESGRQACSPAPSSMRPAAEGKDRNTVTQRFPLTLCREQQHCYEPCISCALVRTPVSFQLLDKQKHVPSPSSQKETDTWMKLEAVTLSDIRPSPKDKCRLVPLS